MKAKTTSYKPSMDDGTISGAFVVMSEGTNQRFGGRVELKGVPLGWVDDERDLFRGLISGGHTIVCNVAWAEVKDCRSAIFATGSLKWKATACPGRRPLE